jgi:hypothetical protein
MIFTTVELHIFRTHMSTVDASSSSSSSSPPKAAENGGGGAAAEVVVPEALNCSVCMEVMCEPTTFPCQHTFCGECVAGLFEKKDVAKCPMCRGGVCRDAVFNEGAEQPRVNTYARDAVVALVGEERYERLRKRFRNDAEESTREQNEFSVAMAVALIYDTAPDAVSAAKLREQTGNADIERLLVVHVRSGALGCARSWIGFNFESPDAEQRIVEHCREYPDSAYYLNQYFADVAYRFLVTSPSLPRLDTGLTLAVVMREAQKMLQAPNSYGITMDAAVNAMRVIVACLRNTYSNTESTDMMNHLSTLCCR